VSKLYFILSKINDFFAKYNLSIRNTTRNFIGYYIQKYEGVDFLKEVDGIYQIPLDKCVSQYYFSYDKKGWHYYRATVEEFVNNPNLKYKDSILHDFYNKFQPKNLYQAFFDDDIYDSPILKNLPNVAVRDFWNLSGTTEQIKSYVVDEETQLFGPISDIYGEEQFRRCVRAYELLKNMVISQKSFMMVIYQVTLLKKVKTIAFVFYLESIVSLV